MTVPLALPPTDPCGPWVQWRQDENGNVVAVARQASRELADGAEQAHAARGHRQLYFGSAGSAV